MESVFDHDGILYDVNYNLNAKYIVQNAEFRVCADYIVPILNIVGAIHEFPVLELRINYRKINLNSWLHLSGELSFAKQKD